MGTTPWTRPARGATAVSIASVTGGVRMWSAIGRSTTFLERMSITVAGHGRVVPTGTRVMSPHHPVFGVSVVKSRITGSGTGGAVLSAIVVRFFPWAPSCSERIVRVSATVRASTARRSARSCSVA
ncbi:hypothetical protein ACFWB2_43930, partial [Streptomyces virginiae]|uniref:hypothetical protein n=1 Tax=Streptomyces virginiae TaxID=1961 RepID=UPI0036ABED2E